MFERVLLRTTTKGQVAFGETGDGEGAYKGNVVQPRTPLQCVYGLKNATMCFL